MSELIDRQALIKQLKDENIPFNADINDIINIQPIAFDVANIVEKLEDEYVDCQKNMNLVRDEDGNEAGHIYDEYLNKSIAYETAINIVKQEIENGLE